MRAADRRSSLQPDPFRPGKALPLSLLGHVAFFGLLWAFSGSAPEARLINPDDVIEVSMVALPKPQAPMPQKEMRQAAPPPRKQVQPVPQAVAAPDLAPVAEPPPQADDTEDRDAAREEAMRQMKREALLESLRTGPEGPVDQAATSTAGAADDEGSADQGVGDVERARYSEDVRRVFYKGFSPLQDDPGLTALAWVWVDDQGRILRHSLETSSGNGSFDAAVERAIRRVESVPVPPIGMVTGGSLRLDLVFQTEDR